jgi:hypothetical protein
MVDRYQQIVLALGLARARGGRLATFEHRLATDAIDEGTLT